MTVFDTGVLIFLSGVTGRFLFVDWSFIFFSEVLIYILTGIFLLNIAKIKNWKHRWEMLSLGAMAVIISRGIFTPLLRFFFENPRPFVALGLEPLVDHASTSSFPSGHIAFIVPLVIVLWYINERAGKWMLAGAVLMGIARIGVGIHWPTDIVGGFLVGIIAFVIAQTLLSRLPERKKRVIKENGAPVGAHE